MRVSVADPKGSETDQVTPPSAVPTTSSVEPPPTSTTPSGPSGGAASAPMAPRNASRASSSASRISSGVPQPASIAAASAWRSVAWRTAAVATIRSETASSSRAWRAWRATIDATSAISSGPSSPFTHSLKRVNARSETTSCRREAPASATSSRVVLEPMSMQAQRAKEVAPAILS